MHNKKQFLEYILSKLEPHGPIWARGMFGGYGIYYRDAMFGLISESILYFRVDEENRLDYATYETQSFVYNSGKKNITLPYIELPEEILDNAELLLEWIEKSRDAAIRYRATHPKKPKAQKNSLLI